MLANNADMISSRLEFAGVAGGEVVSFMGSYLFPAVGFPPLKSE